MAAQEISTLRVDVTSQVCFTINGKQYSVNGEYDVTTSLNDYIREVAGLKGTKVMCREGGCGCCAVAVTKPNPVLEKEKTVSINSCLCPVYSVDGWHITTVEGLGSSKDGFHPIQDRIAKFNATQCGYCTPGMVMNMYGMLQKNRQTTQNEIEDQFDGNICRCTGYRPVLDAMKSFATDSTIREESCDDIEDVKICPGILKRSGHKDVGVYAPEICMGKESFDKQSSDDRGFLVRTGDKSWYRPQMIQTLIHILQTNKGRQVRLVFGNTASGIYKNDGPYDMYVDLQAIEDFYKIESTPTSYIFGSNITISSLVDALRERSGQKGYAYFTHIVKHLLSIGNVLVRNAGSWAGNVMIKHTHPEFPSDIFTLMEAVEARVSVIDSDDGSVSSYSLTNLARNVDMTRKIIVSIELFEKDDRYRFRSYRACPRSQNTKAYVNAAFGVAVDDSTHQVVGKPSIVLGGLDPSMIHATKTEETLLGANLADANVIQGLLKTLSSELSPDKSQFSVSPEYRMNLAVNLFYKFLMDICVPAVPSTELGLHSLDRPLSCEAKEFQEHKEERPLKQPMSNLTATLQASGEAVFINDIPSSTRELYGAFVLTSIANGAIDTVDASVALLMPGVVDFLSLKDLPVNGVNNTMPEFPGMPLDPEELFCSGSVMYAGQALGFVIAESQSLADAAAQKVKVTYKDVRTPIVTIEDAIRENSYHANPLIEHRVGDPEGTLNKAERKVSGETYQGGICHFFLENHVALAVPSEDCLDVFSACQGADVIQQGVSKILGKPMNFINVNVPRVGGAFGGKTFSCTPVAAAASLAAYKLKRPVRSNVSLSTNMKMNGGRFPVLSKYEVGFDDNGTLNVICVDVYIGCGFTNFEFMYQQIANGLDQAYHVPNWRIRIISCKTNTPSGQPMRAPGPYPAGFIIESVLEQVACALGKVSADVKETNLYTEGEFDHYGHELKNCTIRELWKQLRESSEFDKRRIALDDFNKSSRWIKRGITMTPCKFGIYYAGPGFTVDIAIYGNDGTVTISQGGIEIGQGLNTKVTQAVASSLNISTDLIRVLPVNSHTSPNNGLTGASTTSEYTVQSALGCCEILKERISPIRTKHPDYDWKNLVQACCKSGIELSAKYKWTPQSTGGFFQYFVYSAAVAEVELDVLTGESQIRRVDILFDWAESLNPAVDIGQIEGGYVMGIGGLLLEEILYDKATGVVLNDSSWEYKPPTSKDIPIDWRIEILRDSKNPQGIRSSKATGEPPIVLSTGVYYALKQAMRVACRDLTGETVYSKSVAPLTPERLQLGCAFKICNVIK